MSPVDKIAKVIQQLAVIFSHEVIPGEGAVLKKEITALIMFALKSNSIQCSCWEKYGKRAILVTLANETGYSLSDACSKLGKSLYSFHFTPLPT